MLNSMAKNIVKDIPVHTRKMTKQEVFEHEVGHPKKWSMMPSIEVFRILMKLKDSEAKKVTLDFADACKVAFKNGEKYGRAMSKKSK